MSRAAIAGRPDSRARSLGILTMVVASTASGGGLLFARLAYQGGTNTVTLQIFRFFLVIAVLAGFLAWKNQPWCLRGRIFWLTLGLGALQGISSFTYIGSLRYISTSLAVIIVFTYPPLVSVVAHVAGDEALTWRRVAALALSFAGLAIALELSLAGLNLFGVTLAVVASVTFAGTLVLSSRLMRQATAASVWLYMSSFDMALLILIAVVGAGGGLDEGKFGDLVNLVGRGVVLPVTPQGWVGLVGLGLAFTIGFLGFAVGVSLVGPSLSALINNLEPVVAVLASVVVMHETFGPWQAVGGGLVLAGVMLAR